MFKKKDCNLYNLVRSTYTYTCKCTRQRTRTRTRTRKCTQHTYTYTFSEDGHFNWYMWMFFRSLINGTNLFEGKLQKNWIKVLFYNHFIQLFIKQKDLFWTDAVNTGWIGLISRTRLLSAIICQCYQDHNMMMNWECLNCLPWVEFYVTISIALCCYINFKQTHRLY